MTGWVVSAVDVSSCVEYRVEGHEVDEDCWGVLLCEEISGGIGRKEGNENKRSIWNGKKLSTPQ